jgi:hypothetical protein
LLTYYRGISEFPNGLTGAIDTAQNCCIQLTEALKAELVNFQGDSAVPYIVAWRNMLWFSNPRCVWQELLVWQIGKDWLNIAEPVAGTAVSDATTANGELAGPFTMPLVRLAQTYTVEELPVTDNDSAIAGELAFCLWVRRRDPHAWNRAYVTGIPIFSISMLRSIRGHLRTSLKQAQMAAFPAGGGSEHSTAAMKCRPLGVSARPPARPRMKSDSIG